MVLDKALEEVISDEGRCWEVVQRLRTEFSPDLLNQVAVATKEQALARAVNTTKAALSGYEKAGVDLHSIDPGHGIGHIVRDYVNALLMLSKLEVDPKTLFVGFIGGMVHDTGCAVVKRYDDSKRAVKHAEVGALLFRHLAEKNALDVNAAEAALIEYAIAAHTHYLAASTINCADGKERTMEPYVDMVGDRPILAVWTTRWVDRLDCNGPTFVGRHYLTVGDNHKDFDGKQFYDVKFEEYMNPILRSDEEIKAAGGKQTMAEHLRMFAVSQANTMPNGKPSAYGRHDFGQMVTLRDASKAQLMRIIDATQDRTKISSAEEERIVCQWTELLKRHIEPTVLGAHTADRLKRMFAQLPDGYRSGWCNAFRVAIDEYKQWATSRLAMLEEVASGKDIYELPGITSDIRKLIQPAF